MKMQIMDGERRIYWCPGCKDNHQIVVGPGYWGCDDVLESPTVEGSVLVRGSAWEDRVCHSFIRAGRIQFLDDCTHELRGQTVDMVDWPVHR